MKPNGLSSLAQLRQKEKVAKSVLAKKAAKKRECRRKARVLGGPAGYTVRTIPATAGPRTIEAMREETREVGRIAAQMHCDIDHLRHLQGSSGCQFAEEIQRIENGQRDSATGCTASARHLATLRSWFFAAHLQVTGSAVEDEGEWVDEVPDVPQQTNDYDCGVFVAKMGECIMSGVQVTRDGRLPVHQSQMAAVRERICLSVFQGTIV